MGTAGTVFVIVCLKGVLVTWLHKKGWWPDWEERGLRLQEHKRVIKAYEEWCERTGQRPAADMKALAELYQRRGYGPVSRGARMPEPTQPLS